jgi:hypothetical protein
VAGGLLAVNAGGVPTVMVWLALTAAVPTPLEAETVNVKAPDAVGVPDRTPAALSDRPVGRVPLLTANVGAGLPEAVNV